MKTEDLEELFRSVDFDIAEPAEGHQKRFREKLKSRGNSKIKTFKIFPFWIPMSAIAASLVVGFLLFQGIYNNQNIQKQELANVSPQMKTTQDFYASVIKKELYNLEQEKSPATEKIVNDALHQMEILESDYAKLKIDLAKSGQDDRVIYAMISNFQKRIDLLTQVLEKVNNINQIKSTPHENNIL